MACQPRARRTDERLESLRELEEQVGRNVSYTAEIDYGGYSSFSGYAKSAV